MALGPLCKVCRTRHWGVAHIWAEALPAAIDLPVARRVEELAQPASGEGPASSVHYSQASG